MEVVGREFWKSLKIGRAFLIIPNAVIFWVMLRDPDEILRRIASFGTVIKFRLQRLNIDEINLCLPDGRQVILIIGGSSALESSRSF